MGCLPSLSFVTVRPVRKASSTNAEAIEHYLHYLRTIALGGALLVLLAALLAAVVIDGPHAEAQAPFVPTFGAPIAVGSSATQSITVTAGVGGSVNKVAVLTAGSATGDFAAAAAGPSCSGTLSKGQICQQSVTFTPVYPGIRTGAVVLLDNDDNVLGTTYISGVGSGGLPVLVNGNLLPVAGTQSVYDGLGDGAVATSADLYLPASVAVDGAGNIYIADSLHNRVRMVSSGNGATIKSSVAYPVAGIITTIAGTGVAGSDDGDDEANNAQLDSPSGLAIDGAGNLYISDTGNNRVRVISAATGEISTIAAGSLNQPWGLAVDPAGNLYIADTADHRVVRVDAVTQAVTVVAGTGTATANATDKAGDGGAATSAQLNSPHGVALDQAGNLYIADTKDNRIRKVDTAGTITTIAGTGAVGYKGDGASASAAELWAPGGVLVDVAQNIYIADSQNAAIRKINAVTGNINTVVQSAKLKYVFNSTLYTNTLYGPIGLALDGNGNIYIADYLNMRVREIQSNVALLDFTSTAVRAGDTSTAASSPAFVQVENDGNASFSLSSINPVSNAAINSAATSCQSGNTLAVDAACTITAQYAPTTSGNPLFGDVDVTQSTVNPTLHITLAGDATPPNSTTTTLISNHDPSSYGQSVTFTATVTTGKGTGALTGTVTFYDGTTTLQPGAVKVTATSIPNTYTASISTPNLTVGNHDITATYSGDGLHLPTDPAMIPELTQYVYEVTATTVTSGANPSALGSGVTFTATVTVSGGGGIAPDGTVTFNDGGTPIGSGPLNGGTATFTTSTLTAGTHAITASYPGDSGKNILASTSSVFSQDVQGASTTVVGATPNPSTYGTNVTFTATVTSSSGSPATGNVTFFDGSNKIGTVALAGNTGVATLSIATLSAGSHAITASYAGDATSGPGVSAPIIEVVNLIATMTSLSANPTPGIAGKAVALTATVKPITGSGTITGKVTFTDGGKTIGSANVSGGAASITPVLAPGAHAIVATYGGDSNDTGSTSAAMALGVNLATTSVTVKSSASPATVLAAVTFTATVTGNGGVPTGTVTFSVDGAKAGTGTLNGSGEATYADSSLKVGTHNVTATYGGDTDDAASTSSALTQAVQAIATVTSLGQSSTSGSSPQLILVAAITGASGPTPTGTVTFMNGSTTIGAAPVDSSGVATLVPDLATATYNIIANYQGDADHSPSTSSALKVSGAPVGFAMTITPATVSLASSQNATITAKVSSSDGYADTIGLGCGTLPAGVTCHFDNQNLSLKAGGSASVQLTIDTNNPLGGGGTAMNETRRGLNLAGLFFPGVLLLGTALWRFRKRHAAIFGAFLLLALSGAAFMTGCSGLSVNSAVPGTYTVEVTGVGANSNITHYQDITLTITK